MCLGLSLNRIFIENGFVERKWIFHHYEKIQVSSVSWAGLAKLMLKIPMDNELYTEQTFLQNKTKILLIVLNLFAFFICISSKWAQKSWTCPQEEEN